MTRARIYYRYEARDLYVAADLIGVEHLSVVDGVRIGITVPADARLFDPKTTALPAEPQALDRSEARSFGALQASAELDLPATAEEAVADPTRFTNLWIASSVMEEHRRITGVVNDVVGGLVAHARVVLDQIGLGVSSDRLRSSHGQRVAEIATGLFYPVAMSELGWATFRPSSAAPLDPETLDDLLAGGFREPLPTPYVLLADARHVVWKQDAPRSTLLAAMACELRLKETLRAMASPANADLVEMLLSHPRGWTIPMVGADATPEAARLAAFLARQPRDDRVSISTLFHKGMMAVSERSMHHEDPDLWDSVSALIQARNAMAHRGEAPTLESANKGVHAAYAAFLWLERVEAGLPHTPVLTTGPRGLRRPES